MQNSLCYPNNNAPFVFIPMHAKLIWKNAEFIEKDNPYPSIDYLTNIAKSGFEGFVQVANYVDARIPNDEGDEPFSIDEWDDAMDSVRGNLNNIFRIEAGEGFCTLFYLIAANMGVEDDVEPYELFKYGDIPEETRCVAKATIYAINTFMNGKPFIYDLDWLKTASIEDRIAAGYVMEDVPPSHLRHDAFCVNSLGIRAFMNCMCGLGFDENLYFEPRQSNVGDLLEKAGDVNGWMAHMERLDQHTMKHNNIWRAFADAIYHKHFKVSYKLMVNYERAIQLSRRTFLEDDTIPGGQK